MIFKEKNNSDYHFSFLSAIHFQLYLNKSSLNENLLAREHLKKALHHSPELLLNFEDYFSHWVSKEPNGEYISLAKKALNNFPADQFPVKFSRRKILGKLSIVEAFYHYRKGLRISTIQKILKGFCYSPSEIKNYGVWVILIKSLGGIKFKQNQCFSQSTLLSTKNLPESLKNEFESSINCKITTLEHHNSGNPSEKIYELKTQNQDYILRTFSKNHVSLKIRLKIIQELGTHKIQIPELIANSKPQSTQLLWLLEEKISGNLFFPNKFSEQENLEILSNIAENLSRLHTITVKGFGTIINSNLETSFSSFEEWLNHEKDFILGGFFSGIIPESLSEMLDKAFCFLKQIDVGIPVLCHGDLQPENLIITENKIPKIIDWESVSGNDPAYDIAIFITSLFKWYPFPENRILKKFLLMYEKNNDPTFFLRVIAHQVLILANNYIWEAKQTNVEIPDFDITDLNNQLSILLDQSPFFSEKQTN